MEFILMERGKVKPAARRYPFANLVRDNWDDQGYQTSFFLEVHTEDRRTIQVGVVKILRLDQREGPTEVPRYFEGSLSDQYCSLGQNLAYYETLRALGPNIYQPVLRGLRDVVYQPEVRTAFSQHPGFSASLVLRGSSARALEDAVDLFQRTGEPSPEGAGRILSLSFRSNVGGSEFDIPLRFNDTDLLPSRINAVIGYNGTGKTQLLANLAMVAHADFALRADPIFSRRFGTFVENTDVPFGSVISVSYSAFDTFEVPGRTAQDREYIRRSGDVRGYSYCGLRSFDHDEPEPHRLKGIAEISREFAETLSRVSTGPSREIVDDALECVAQDASFQRLGFTPEQVHQSDFVLDIFPSLSTGHKIVLNIIVQLSAHLQRRSLVLIDEPESHLHPPLLAALLRSISILLERRDSFAVVATHAPVVIQEIPKKYVRVLRRFESVTLVEDPEIETFGENVGILTRQVFNLDSSATDYQGVLRSLAENFTLAEIESLFDAGLSVQARSYVVSIQKARRG
ncbi:AAA family ATPase [Paractinoplanes ferrugineus]|uniref:AAA family ATPase n=1 Tax=Paractinoplanes ferrugineus TaxID=113564 RepID=UPI00194208A7|nr:AAA family ATPase [Actinoplanes ferrugineus]